VTIKDLLKEYLDGDTDAINVIRTLSGIFPPEAAIDHLALICQITRIEQGDMEKETFEAMYFKEEPKDE